MVKAKDLRDLSLEDLEFQCNELSRDLFELKNEMKVNRKMERPHMVRQKKKDRARVMTVLREKESTVRG